MLTASCLLCLLFNPEDGSRIILQKSITFYKTKRYIMPDDDTLHGDHCKNLNSHIIILNKWTVFPCFGYFRGFKSLPIYQFSTQLKSTYVCINLYDHVLTYSNIFNIYFVHFSKL
jgi:hypothetical protein